MKKALTGLCASLCVAGCQSGPFAPAGRDMQMAQMIAVPGPSAGHAAPPSGLSAAGGWALVDGNKLVLLSAPPGTPDARPVGVTAAVPAPDPVMAAPTGPKVVQASFTQAVPAPTTDRSRAMEVELTREMCNQIVDLKQKVQELAARTKGEPAAEKFAEPAKAEVAETPVPVAKPVPTQAPMADDRTRAAQVELTREMCRQIVDLKQKVQELTAGPKPEAVVEAAKADGAELRKQMERLRQEVVALKGSPKPTEPRPLPEAFASTPSAPATPVTPAAAKAPAAAPAKPVPPGEMSGALQQEINRQIAANLRDVRKDLTDLKARVPAPAGPIDFASTDR